MLVKRKISNNFYIFEKTMNVVILVAGEYGTRQPNLTINYNCDISKVRNIDLPIGLTIACLEKKYSIVLIDTEMWKMKIFKFINKLITEEKLIKIISENSEKLIKYQNEKIN